MALADYVKYDPDILRRKLAGEYQLANQQQAFQNAQMNQALAQQLAPYQQQEQLLQVQKLQQALDPAFQAQQNALNLQNRLAEVTAVQEIQNQFNAKKPIEIGGRGWLPDPNDPTKYIEVIKKVEDPYAAAQLEKANLDIAKAQREADPAFQESQDQRDIKKAREIAKATAEGKPPPVREIDRVGSENLSSAKTAFAQLQSLKKEVEKNSDLFGPVAGRVNLSGPYNTRRETLKGKIKTVAQAIGKYMEGGVLRKEDEIKYEQMLGGLESLSDVVINKLGNVDQFLGQKYSDDLTGYSQSGYDISKFPKTLSPERDEAMKWLELNPDDSRAPAIRKKLGL